MALNLKKNRKALLLTLLTLIIFMLMTAEVITYYEINYSYTTMASSASQSAGAASFAQLMSSGYSSVLYQSLHNSLYGLIAYESNAVIAGNNPVNSTPVALKSLIYNGTLNGGSMVSYVGTSNISSYTGYIQRTALLEGINVIVSNVVINVYQGGPFLVNASLSFNSIITYSSGSITYPVHLTTSVNVTGTPDLWSLETGNAKIITPGYGTFAQPIAGNYVKSGSTSPFLFDYGTVVNVENWSNSGANFGTSILCANVPSAYRNGNYILVTANAVNVNSLICGMGGLVTYFPNSVVPLAPYLVYNSVSFVANTVQNGTRLLLSGSSLELLNVTNLVSAIQKGFYIPSASAPSYLDRSSGLTASQSPYGTFSFLTPNLQASSFRANSYVTVGNIQIPSNGASVSAWIYPTNTISGKEEIFSAGENINNGIALWIDANALKEGSLWVRIGSGNIIANTPANTFSTNQWYFVAGVWNGTSANLYVNGNLITKVAGSGTISGNNDIARIGSQNANPISSFLGKIADVQVYTGGLTTSQVYSLYTAGIDAAPVSSNILYWWPLNGNFTNQTSHSYNSVASNVVFTSVTNYQGDATTGALIPGYANFNLALNCGNPTVCTNSSTQGIYLPNYPSPKVLYLPGSVVNSITIPASNGIAITSNFSVAAWIDSVNSVISANSEILDFGNTLLRINNGQACFYAGNGISNSVCSSQLVPLNQWAFIAATYANGIERIYLNGISRGNAVYAGTPSSIPLTGAIGKCSYCSNTYPFNGYISGVQVYNSTLPQNAITSIYSQGLGGSPSGYSLNAWWPLNGNAIDYGNGGYPGTPNNAVYAPSTYFYNPVATSLNLSKAYLPDVVNFNGNGSIAIPANLVVGASAFTVSGWIYPTNMPNSNMDIISAGEAQNTGFYFAVNGIGGADLIDLWARIGGANVVETSAGGTIVPNKWYFVAGVYNGVSDTEVVYINGNVAGSRAASGAITQPTTAATQANTVIGGRNDFNTKFLFAGDIADLRVYSVGLTSNQIASLYLNDSLSANSPSESYYWPLEGPFGGQTNQTADTENMNSLNTGTFYTITGGLSAQRVACTVSNVIRGLCGTSYVPG
jgi:hypothetical protein